MLQIKPMALVRIATDNGWMHERGRLAGTVNASAMARGLGLSTTTVTRAYNGEAGVGSVLLPRLREFSGLPLDELVTDVAEDHAA